MATTDTSLIVAGGWGPDMKKAPVEVMDLQTLYWTTRQSASLPSFLYQASTTICEGRLYIGGGYGSNGATKSVVMCEVKDLLQSISDPRSSLSVWKEVAPLPVVLSSLVTFQGQLLAVGGTHGQDADTTTEVMQYDVTTGSWKVISHMRVQRRYSLAAVLPNNTLKWFVVETHLTDLQPPLKYLLLIRLAKFAKRFVSASDYKVLCSFKISSDCGFYLEAVL